MTYDLICIGMALVDSIIKGFDPKPVSASGYRAVSGTLNAGGEAVNGAMAAAKLGLRTGILCSLGDDAAADLKRTSIHLRTPGRLSSDPFSGRPSTIPKSFMLSFRPQRTQD